MPNSRASTRASNKIGGAGIECAVAEGFVLVGGDDNDRHILAALLSAKRGGKRSAIHRPHLEITDDDVGDILLGPLERLDRVGEALHVGTGHERGREARIDPPVGDLIVDDGD